MNREQVVDMFLQALKKKQVGLYRKFGEVSARRAVPGEEVATVIDGQVETTNTATEGDFIVKNPGGEQYVVEAEKFAERYEHVSGTPTRESFATYRARGECYAFVYSGPPFAFQAPWGELMQVKDGDFIAVADLADLQDIYRIQRQEFLATYQKIAA